MRRLTQTDAHPSVKQLLILWLLGALFCVSVMFIMLTYGVKRASIDAMQDERLQQIALGIPPRLKSADLRSINVKLFHGRDDFLLQIWRNGHEVYRSDTDLALPSFSGEGFAVRTYQSEPWRLYIRHMGDYAIQVAQSVAERDALARERAFDLIVPLLIFLPIIGLLIPICVDRGLSSLNRFSNHLDTLTPERLVRIDHAREPKEIGPLINAINGLLGTMEEATQNQQRFLTDASHELRTPMATLRIQMRLAEQATSPEQRRAAFDALDVSIRRTGRLIEQLLAKSRLDASGLVQRREPLVFNDVVREAVLRLEPLASTKGLDLGLMRDDRFELAGDRDELSMMVGNLVDNAIRYTPDGGRIDIAIIIENGRGLFVVEDSGPGIPVDYRGEVFQRFFRCPGENMQGSGLGLAIVRQIAERHACAITLDSSEMLGGLKVNVAFPT